MCLPVTDDKKMCMQNAGSKNSTDVLMHCKGVDLDALEKGDVRLTIWIHIKAVL